MKKNNKKKINSISMKKLHNRLMDKGGSYASWHNSKAHQPLHWLAFLIAGLFFTALLMMQINGVTFPKVGTKAATITCDYYAAPDAASSGTGSSSSPWQLRTALNKGSALSGKTLCLKGGTYYGKYKSNLVGATVRGMTSSPSDPNWAKIDGYATTTLANSINATQTSGIVLTDATNFPSDSDITIHGDQSAEQYEEHIKLDVVSGNTVTSAQRGRGIEGNGVGKAHAAGAMVVSGGNQLDVYGSDTTYINFEITNSDPVRSWGAYGNSQDSPHYRKECIMHYGPRTKLINLVLHDCQEGIFGGQGQAGGNNGGEDSETYGNVIYNNGYRQNVGIANANGLAGHGWYIQHDGPGYKTYKENITFNNNVMGAQEESVSGIISNIINSGNVVINNTFLVGANGAYADNITTADNFFYSNTKGPSYGGGLVIGYGDDDLRSFSITNNYFGLRNDVLNNTEPAAMNLGRMVTATVTGNTLITAGSSSGGYDMLLQAKAPRGGGAYNINNNTYYDQSRLQNCAGPSARTAFGYNGMDGYCGGKLIFTEWKTATGWDSNSTYAQAVAPNKVFVRPNAYEQGRANIIIYNWSNAGTVNVDLSNTGLINGQQYEIRNVMHYFTNPIVGTYNSSNPVVSINMNDTEVTQPVGNDLPTRYTTMPEFGTFVVVPVGSGGGGGGGTTPTAINSFSSSSTNINAGESATLSWTVTGTAPITLSLNGTTVSGTSIVVAPTTTTTYTLTATGPGGSATSNPVTITVTAAPSPVATPSISPSGGSFTNIQPVTLATATSGAAIRYTTNGSNPSSTNGTLYSGPFTLSASATVKAIAYKSGQPDSAIASATFTKIISAAHLDISATSLSFNGVAGSAAPAAQSITLSNSGNASTTWSASATATWCKIAPASGTLAAAANTNLSISVTAQTAPATLSCTITISSNADNTPQTIAVDYNVSPAVPTPTGHYMITPASLSFTAVTGTAAPAAKTVVIKNTGTAAAFWGATWAEDWCTVSPTSDTLAPGAQQTITIAVDDPSNVGSFSCNINIAGDADNSPQVIPVSYTVTAPATTVATPSISPNGGSFTNTQSVTLVTATAGAAIRYTTDGSDPSTTAGTLYSGAFTLSASATVKAIAYKTGSNNSAIASANFTKTTTAGAVPVFRSVSVSAKTRTTATITWKTSLASSGKVAYSANPNNLNQTSATVSTPISCTSTGCTYQVTLTGLNPYTVYYYKVTATNSAGDKTTNRASFRTRR